MRWKITILLSFIACLAACSGGQQGSSVVAGEAAPQQTYSWKMVTTWPKNFPGLGTAPENFSKLVERMSAGRLVVKVYGANELVPALQAFDAVQQGTAEMSHGGAYYWRGKVPISPFFAAVPFGLNAQEMNAWIHHGGGLELWREAYEPFNLVPFAGGNTGVQMAGWFNKEINSVDDLKGLKMRIPGLGGEVFNKIGGTSVNLSGGELFTSMQSGAIDATEWVGPYNDLAFGLYQTAKYYYYPGWHEPGATLEFTVNKQAWDSLPEDLQAIVEAAARVVNQDMLDEFTASNIAALKTLVEEHGVELRKLPEDVLKALKVASEEVSQQAAQASPFAQKVYDSYTSFRAGVVDWHAISEKAYVEARALE